MAGIGNQPAMRHCTFPELLNGDKIGSNNRIDVHLTGSETGDEDAIKRRCHLVVPTVSCMATYGKYDLI